MRKGRKAGKAIGRIYARSWEVIDLLDRYNVGLIAAGIGFFSTLAIFPALAAVVLVWSVFSDPTQITIMMDMVVEVVPPDVYAILNDQLVNLTTAASRETLGWASVVSLSITLWSARAGVAALIRGLNAVYQVTHRPNTIRRYFVAMLITLSLCGAAIVTFALVILLPIFFNFLHLGSMTAMLVEAGRWLISILTVIFALGLIYRYGPNRRGDRPGWLTPGAVLAAALWLGVSVAFSYYLGNFAHYNEVYGSLGAVAALLMWLYLSAYVVLLGATLNATLERERAHRRARRAEKRAEAQETERPVPA
ncbi:YihY family inner membrane protein [Aquicoccus sp. SCR17]|nr:YihY family inner membrane protein [Carideicomes alvinocaridis]